MIDRVHWIDKEKLAKFILDCQVTSPFDQLFQLHIYIYVFMLLFDLSSTYKTYLTLWMQDTEKGGISDRPDDAVDVFHTYFGVAGKSSMIMLNKY